MTPAGVTVPCGAISVTLSPVNTRSARARSAPRTTPNSPGRRSSRLPLLIVWRKSATRSSWSGRMPRTSAPLTPPSTVNIACDWTKGAAARTSGCCAACAAIAGQSLSSPLMPVIWMCEATPRMRVRSSFWKPFITDSTTISAATPRPMPSIEISEMKEMKWLRRLARV